MCVIYTRCPPPAHKKGDKKFEFRSFLDNLCISPCKTKIIVAKSTVALLHSYNNCTYSAFLLISIKINKYF